MIDLPSDFADQIASSSTAFFSQISGTVELIVGVLVAALAAALLLNLFRR